MLMMLFWWMSLWGRAVGYVRYDRGICVKVDDKI